MCLVKVVKKFQFFENKGVLHNKTPIGAPCFDVTSLPATLVNLIDFVFFFQVLHFQTLHSGVLTATRVDEDGQGIKDSESGREKMLKARFRFPVYKYINGRRTW